MIASSSRALLMLLCAVLKRQEAMSHDSEACFLNRWIAGTGSSDTPRLAHTIERSFEIIRPETKITSDMAE